MDVAREPPHRPRVGRVTVNDLYLSLREGAADFRRAPLFGLFFSGAYVAVGILLLWIGAGLFSWTLTVSLAFPLFAPFAAVGLYEVSRRMEAGAPLRWGAVLGVVLGEKDRQIPWMGAMIVFYALFWTALAHLLFALFMGPAALTGGASLDMLSSPAGLALLLVGGAIGAVLAFVLFSLTVVSLPLLLDREVDVVTAMLTSLSLVRGNLPVMLAWAALIAALLFVAMLPAFLGLLAILPILGHASWRLYRRATRDEG